MSRRRALTREEIALWGHVTRQVAPLHGRAALPDLPPAAEPVAGPQMPPVTNAPPAKPRKAPAPPPLAPLEAKVLRAIRRGTRPVEAVLDLHGMKQDEAHSALRAFLRARQAAGTTLVVVITGKGAATPWIGGEGERGVLRRQVPHWLRLADLRPIVLGFEEAAAQHGGSGALYVRLRRARRRDPP